MTEIITLEKMFNDEKYKVRAALQSGAVIAYPTDTIYGLGVDAFNAKAVRSLLDLKRRPPGKPVSVLYTDIASVFRDFKHLNDFQQKVVRALLPGKVTLILPTGPQSRFPKEITSDNTLGVRVIDLEPLNCLLRLFPHPITTTSVNPAGEPPARTVAEILSYFGAQISLILAHGEAINSLPSTIIKIGESDFEILRPGAVSPAEIKARISRQ